MAAAGWLNDGERVLRCLNSVPAGHTKGNTTSGHTTQLGVITELLVVTPLQKRIGAALYGDENADITAATDPAKEIPCATLNTMLTVTTDRLIVHEWKGLGKLGDLYAEFPREECTVVVAGGGSGPSKHRLVHVSGPDGRWVLREVVELGGGGKRVDEFEAAMNGAI